SILNIKFTLLYLRLELLTQLFSLVFPMTQPNLLESAKQGDPEAIATLMNLALQPKGVTAELQIVGKDLHVFLSSTRILNQQTLVSFTRKGLANLGLGVIQTVKVYGKKIGEDLPIWTEVFAMVPATELPPTKVETTERQFPKIVQPSLPQSNDASKDKFTPAKIHLRQVQTGSNRLVPRVQSHLNRLLFATEQITAQIPLPKQLFPAGVRPSRFLAALTLVSLPAFLLGVAVAVVSAFAVGSARRSGALLPNASGNQSSIPGDVEQAILKQQTDAQKYLETMNRAQQDFYTKNKRFASSLEELERSASVISQSYNYTYSLTLSGKNQAQLAATPKAKGLKSFTSIVLLIPSEQEMPTPVSTICESSLPSMIPPRIPAPVENQVQCPSGASKVS
ncbi:MAG: type IV pilin-like G/H family protein, partial [Kovacikia sp.]